MADPRVRTGTKIFPGEAKTLDRSRMGVATTQRPQAEVEGQFGSGELLVCPWCGHANWEPPDPNTIYQWYTCGGCGLPFRA